MCRTPLNICPVEKGMTMKWIIAFVLLTTLLIGIVPAAGSSGALVSASDRVINTAGESTECPIILEKAVFGLSGYEISVSLEDPEIAEITGMKFPAWAGLNSRGRLPADRLTFKGADSSNKVKSGDRSVILGTAIIRGDRPGSTRLNVAVIRLEDESGSNLGADSRDGTVVVRGVDTSAGTREVPSGDTIPAIITSPVMTPSPDPVKTTETPLPEVTTIPEEGTVIIDTIPAGASAFIDEIYAGDTPLTRTGIRSGMHTLRLEKEGWEVFDYGVFHVSTGEITRIEHVSMTRIPESGSVYFESEPAGTTIVIDGAESGTAPAILILKPGTHTLIAEKTGFLPYKGTVMVPPGQTIHYPCIVLEKEPGYIITATSSGNGTISPEGVVPVDKNGNITFIVTPAPGNVIGNVTLDGVQTGPEEEIPFFFVTSNHTLRVEFEPGPVVQPAEPENTPLIAEFSSDIRSGTAPLTVHFTDGSAGTVSGYEWDFGDEALVKNDGNCSHTYGDPGNYTVSLTVYSGTTSTTTTKTGYIQVLPLPDPLTADFVANVTTGVSPLPVQFTSSSTGAPETWYWEFGDGANSTEEHPLHIFEGKGIFNVSLTVGRCDITDTLRRTDYISVVRPVTGGDTGTYTLYCTIENASVYFDSECYGLITNGSFVMTVYTTATPFTTYGVKAPGYVPYKANIRIYPDKGENIALHVNLIPQPSYDLNPPKKTSSYTTILSNISSQWV
jgi:PKD repeat protein